MLIKPLRPDWRIPRDWKRPWREHGPGFFMACCPPCGSPPPSCCGIGANNIHCSISGTSATTLGLLGAAGTITLTYNGVLAPNELIWQGHFTSTSGAFNGQQFPCTLDCFIPGHQSGLPAIDQCDPISTFFFFFSNNTGTCGLECYFCSDGTLKNTILGSGLTTSVVCSPLSIVVAGTNTCSSDAGTFTITT